MFLSNFYLLNFLAAMSHTGDMTPPAGASCDDPARSEAVLAAQLKDLKESRAEITTKIVNLVAAMSGTIVNCGDDNRETEMTKERDGAWGEAKERRRKFATASCCIQTDKMSTDVLDKWWSKQKAALAFAGNPGKSPPSSE
jgi:hypothetical protein